MGIALGSIGPAQFAAAATEAENGNVEFFLSEGIAFFEGSTITSIRPADVQRLLDAPLHLPEWMKDGLELAGGEKDVKVRSCREYRDALREGLYAASQAAITNSSHFQIPLGILSAVEISQQPKATYFANFALGPNAAMHLPASLVDFDAEFPARGGTDNSASD